MSQPNDAIESCNFTPPLEPTVMVFVGEPKLGKITLIKAIMQYYTKKKYFKFGLCMTGSMWNKDYDFLPKKAVWDGWDEERFKNYIGVLEERASKLADTDKKLPPSFIILDDLLGKMSASECFKSFLSRFRHYNITVLLAVQYVSDAKACSTVLRAVCELAFMFPSIMDNQIDAMHRSWGGYYKNSEEFKQAIIMVKKRPYACLLFQKKYNSKETAYKSFLCKPALKDYKVNFDAKQKTDAPV